MFRFLLVAACLAVPVFGNSAGAPLKVCENDLVPEHHVEPQASPVPYSFSGESRVSAGSNLALVLGGGEFLGFAVQARDAKDSPIGQFKIVEGDKSQTISCARGTANTLTHKKIPRESPVTSVKFEWSAPQGYKGKVKFVGTVAKDGGTYWIRKVLKEVDVV